MSHSAAQLEHVCAQSVLCGRPQKLCRSVLDAHVVVAGCDGGGGYGGGGDGCAGGGGDGGGGDGGGEGEGDAEHQHTRKYWFVLAVSHRLLSAVRLLATVY